MKKIIAAASLALALASTAGPALAADKVYEVKCIKCHGANGDGKGKMADMMDPKPTDFTAADWQAKHTDEDITEAITNGGRSSKLKIGKKMPAFGEKLKKEEIQVLVKAVRGFGKR
jgi:cytochrome c oxidase cbb3-type subunit 3